MKLYFNEYIVLFPDQVFKNSLWQKTRPSICFKTPGRVFQLLVRWAFEALRENQKLDQEFEKFGQVWLKSLATFLSCNTTHDVTFSHGKEY